MNVCATIGCTILSLAFSLGGLLAASVPQRTIDWVLRSPRNSATTEVRATRYINFASAGPGAAIDLLIRDVLADGHQPLAVRSAVAGAILKNRHLVLLDFDALSEAIKQPSNNDLAMDRHLRAMLEPRGRFADAIESIRLTLLANFITHSNAEPKLRVPELTTFYNDDVYELFSDQGDSPDKLDTATLERDFDAIDSVRTFLNQSTEPEYKRFNAYMPHVIPDVLDHRKFHGIEGIIRIVDAHRPIATVGVSIASVFSIYVIIWWLFPLLLLRADQSLVWLASDKGLLPAVIQKFLSLATLLNRSKHVQDAWLNRYSKLARQALDGNFVESGLDRNLVFVPLPVKVQKRATDPELLLDKPSIKNIRPYVSNDHVLISGEGGVGKSTLAYYLASLALLDRGSSIWTHKSLPIVVRASFDGSNYSGADQFINYIAAQVEAFLPSGAIALNPAIIRSMLNSRRILLVVDGLSEMPSPGLELIKNVLGNLPVKAAIFTTRTEAVDAGLPAIKMRPQPIDAHNLIDFLKLYIERSGLYGSLGLKVDAVCDRLKGALGATVLPLFVRIYVETLAGARDQALLPIASIPPLILDYVGYLNNRVTPQSVTTAIIIDKATRLAHACCIETKAYCSSLGSVEQARNIFGDDLLLSYFVWRLTLIRLPNENQLHFRFNIDPVCEYLAAIYVVEQCRSDLAGLAPLREHVEGRSSIALETFVARCIECADSSVYTGSIRRELIAALEALREGLRVRQEGLNTK